MELWAVSLQTYSFNTLDQYYILTNTILSFVLFKLIVFPTLYIISH